MRAYAEEKFGEGFRFPFGVEQVDLSFLDGRKGAGRKASPFGPEGGRFGQSGYHGALLDDHRYGIHPPVDPKVGGDAERQVVVGQGVFGKAFVQGLQGWVGVQVVVKGSGGLLRIGGKGFQDAAGLFLPGEF